MRDPLVPIGPCEPTVALGGGNLHFQRLEQCLIRYKNGQPFHTQIRLMPVLWWVSAPGDVKERIREL